MTEFVKLGDVIRLDETHKVYAVFPKSLVNQKCKNDEYTARVSADLNAPRFAFLKGDYVVIRTGMEGGGTGHGPHDVYPDGYYVTAMNLNHPEIEVGFFQSGCFNTLNESVKVVGKAKQTWTVKEMYE